MLIRDAESLGQLIRDRRRQLGWSQTQLGERIGASRFWVGEVEKGKATAEVGRVIAALRALGLSVNVQSAVGVDRLDAETEDATVSYSSSMRPGAARRPTLTRGGKPLRASREFRRDGDADGS